MSYIHSPQISLESELNSNFRSSLFSSIVYGTNLDSEIYAIQLKKRIFPTLKPHQLLMRNPQIVGQYTFSLDPTMTKVSGSNTEGTVEIYSIKDMKKKDLPHDLKAIQGDFLYSLKGHQGMVTYHLFSTIDTEKSYTASLDKTVRIWKGKKCIKKIETSDWIRAFAASPNEQFLYIGTIDSTISVYDQNQEKMLFTMNNVNSNNPKDTFAREQASNPSWLNSVNSIGLEKNFDANLFLAGFRDGRVRLYDKRTLPASIQENSQYEIFSLIAHGTRDVVAKVNSCEFLSNNFQFLTSGRDSTIRLFDIRMISNGMHYSETTVQEWNKHSCTRYILSTCIMDDEFIVTGSEDNNIYIYDLYDPTYYKVLKYHSAPVHLVKAQSGMILSCDIDTSGIVVWEPDLTCETPEGYASPPSNRRHLWEQWLFERVMELYGEEIMARFHAYSSTNNATATPDVAITLSRETLRQLADESMANDNFTEEDKKRFQDIYNDSQERGATIIIPGNFIVPTNSDSDDDFRENEA